MPIFLRRFYTKKVNSLLEERLDQLKQSKKKKQSSKNNLPNMPR